MKKMLLTALFISLIVTPTLPQRVDSTRKRVFRKTILTSKKIKTHPGNIAGVHSQNTGQIHPNELHASFVRSGLLGSVAFGVMGAILGFASKSRAYGSSDVYQIPVGDVHATRMGLSIGSGVGSVIGFANRQKQIKKEKWFLRVLIGSAVGSVAGYYLSDIPAGFFGTFVLPPILADVALRL